MARPPRTEFGAARRRAPMTSGISRGSYGTWTMPPSAPRVACDTAARRGFYTAERAASGPTAPPATLNRTKRLSRPVSAEIDRAQTADLGHPLLGQPVGRDRGRDVLFVGEREDSLGGLEDAGGAQLGPLE